MASDVALFNVIDVVTLVVPLNVAEPWPECVKVAKVAFPLTVISLSAITLFDKSIVPVKVKDEAKFDTIHAVDVKDVPLKGPEK